LTGESAGAWSVCYQMVSPGAKGLFVRAIMQSGSCTDRRSLARADEADRDGDAFARKLGCGDSDDVLACLRKLPAGKIARAPSPRRGVIGPGSWGPVWKDPVVPLNPAEAFATGRYNAVPVIIGTNRDEGRLFALTVLSVGNQKKYEAQLREDWGTRAPDVLAHYPAESYGGSPDLAYAAVLTDGRFACPAQELRGLLAKRSTVRGYEFADEDAPIVLPEFLLGAPMGAYHASELAYVFGSRWVLADVASFTPAQAQLSDRMMRAWGRFVRGEPFAEDWPAGDGVLVFQPQGDATSTDFAQRHQCDFWQGVSVGN
jgi:para-nitrobenzyl esterase